MAPLVVIFAPGEYSLFSTGWRGSALLDGILDRAGNMETLLNLIWLVLALAGLWVWRFHWLVSRPNPRARLYLEAVAIGCALALLFPVISLTDDLHPEIVAVDASSGKRNACLMVAGVTRTPHVTSISSSHVALTAFRPVFGPAERNIAGIFLPPENLHQIFAGGSRSGRSPPSFQ